MKRHSLVYKALLATVSFTALASAAHADDLSITGTASAPVSTSNALNGAGNITITAGSVISIAASGAAVTLNSNNLVDNQGNIENTFANGNAVGLHIVGGNAGEYHQEANGFINVTGAGAGNYGLLVDGPAPFTGNITMDSGAVVVTHGTNNTAVQINAQVNGNVTLNGVINAFDPGANGVVVTAPVTGTFQTGGSAVFVSAYPDPTLFSVSQIDPLTGYGVAIGASIQGGIINTGSAFAGDVTTVSSIQSSGTLPTMQVAPSIAGAAAADIHIGQVITDATNPSFSLINRGNIINKDNDPGISTIGLVIGELSSGPAAHSTTLDGGLYNRGTISATSETDNVNASSVAPRSANATALIIGSGATLVDAGTHTGAIQGVDPSHITLDSGASSINNYYLGMTVTLPDGEVRQITSYDGTSKTADLASFNGSNATIDLLPAVGSSVTVNSSAMRNDGSIASFVSGTESATSVAMQINAHGTVPTLINSGSIKAEAYSSLTTTHDLIAYAIRDQSGTLNNITNSGTIAAISGYNPSGLSASPLDDNSQRAIALDLSVSTARQTIVNYGQITGDVLLSNAGMADATHAGNQLYIEGAQAGVSGAVRTATGGTIDIHVSSLGGGGTLLTNSTQATSIDVGQNGQVVFLLTKTSLNQTTIATTGDVTFKQGGVISVLPGSFLADGTYTLISSGTKIHYDDAADTTNFTVPYLFHAALTTDNNSSLANDGKTLNMTITRKTTAELGLQGNSAAIYDSLSAAALNDDSFGAALMSLTTQDQVQDTLDTAVPDVAGGIKALVVSMTDQATGVIGARQRSLLTAPAGSRDEFRFWAQEFYNNVQQDATPNQAGFSGAGQGLSVGAEWGKFASGRYGLGLTFFSSQEIEEHPRDTKSDGDWFMASAYAAWKADNFFIAPQLNVGSGSLQSRRTIIAGNITRLAFAQWDSQVASGGFTAGYVLDLGSFQVIPTLALDGLYLREGQYKENNAGGVGVALDSQNQKSVRGFAGIIGQGTYNYDQGVLMPQFVAGYSREFMNDPSTIDGYFEAAPGSPFHLVGPTLEPSHLVGGMSLGYVLHNWSAGVNYDASANSGSLAQSATISISSRF